MKCDSLNYLHLKVNWKTALWNATDLLGEHCVLCQLTNQTNNPNLTTTTPTVTTTSQSVNALTFIKNADKQVFRES